MNIVIFIDKEGTAIDRLAKSIKRTLDHHNIIIFPVHPKGNDVDTLIEAQRLMTWADVIDIHYWKSGQILRTSFPKEFESKPRILFHFNPYDLENEENKYYDKVVVGNSEMYHRLPSAILIPYGVDLSFFTFNENYTEESVVNMSVNRIEGKKGVEEVAQACRELGYKFKLIGRVSKPEYMTKVMEAGKGVIEFYEGVTDEKLREIYYQSAIHVCNSTTGFESGTLPILENMSCGVPVLTRRVGHVSDLYDGKNMIIREGEPEDVEGLKVQLKAMIENRDWRLNLREKAWETVRGRDDRKMALAVNRLYNEIYEPDKPLISIILPTKDNPEAFIEALLGSLQQDYPKLEIVVSDSGNTPVKAIVDRVKGEIGVPIKYIYFPHKNNYTLAEARNRAVIEASGQYLLFCDDRLKMASNAVTIFSVHRLTKTWYWGMKDGVSKGFVENFSYVNRRELISGGMFCERMQWYGGMTQEIRERFEREQGFDFVFVEEAKAEAIKRSRSKKSRREDIIEAKYLVYKMHGQ